MDKDKKAYITSYQERRVRIKALKTELEELQNQIEMTKMYQKRYKDDETKEDKDKVNYF